MSRFAIALGTMALGLSTATAQTSPGPFIYKPVDTSKYLVQPTDKAVAVTAGATTSTFRTITRSVANAIENNGFVKTINNLLGKRAKPDPVQAGFSPLPVTQAYQSQQYPNAFKPAMPIAGVAGTSANVPITTSPTDRR
jgi:hypothetical protein